VNVEVGLAAVFAETRCSFNQRKSIQQAFRKKVVPHVYSIKMHQKIISSFLKTPTATCKISIKIRG
jgi:hypothetical protein